MTVPSYRTRAYIQKHMRHTKRFVVQREIVGRGRFGCCWLVPNKNLLFKIKNGKDEKILDHTYIRFTQQAQGATVRTLELSARQPKNRERGTVSIEKFQKFNKPRPSF